MAKQVKPTKQVHNKPKVKNIPKQNIKNLYTIIEDWLEKRSFKVFLTIGFLCLIFSVLLFNARIDEGGDDSSYIQAGYNWASDFFHYYYSFQAPLYPLILSIPIKLFGLNLILLKSLSLIFNLLNLFFLYKALKGRIPYLIMFTMLIIISMSSYFLYFASQTYNEAFFLFVQALFFYGFFKLLDTIDNKGNAIKETWKLWLLTGFLSFLMLITKNIAIGVIGVVIVYFIIKKQYYNSIISIISIGIFALIFQVARNLIWGGALQYTSQGKTLLLKDPYDTTKGYEDLWGYFSRLINNADLFLSKRFMQIIGFKNESSIETSTGLTIFIVILMLWSLYRIFKNKNKYMLFISLYSILIPGLIFTSIQTRWDQPRLILILVPFLLLSILYGLYDIFKKGNSIIQSIFIYLIIFILIPPIYSTFSKIPENIKILKYNLKGNIYYGYTPDWENFLRMSEWCGKNLPKGS
ncbi:MAG: hypothetical protein Q8880_05740, partial [Bacteroidota bacterium]|nr:hypothetical protein [Bacteroidota bacterium]